MCPGKPHSTILQISQRLSFANIRWRRCHPQPGYVSLLANSHHVSTDMCVAFVRLYRESDPWFLPFRGDAYASTFRASFFGGRLPYL
jgi:hypothetical protein